MADAKVWDPVRPGGHQTTFRGQNYEAQGLVSEDGISQDVADWAALLAISSPTDGMRRSTLAPPVSGGVPAVKWRYDGSLWRLDGPQCLFASYTPVTGSAGTTEQTLFVASVPAGLLLSLRHIRVAVLFSKSGTADATTCRIRLGTVGASPDAIIMSSTALTAGNRVLGVSTARYASSDTELTCVGAQPTSMFLSAAATLAYPNTVTVPSMYTTDLILSASIQMGGSTDVPTIAQVIVSGDDV